MAYILPGMIGSPNLGSFPSNNFGGSIGGVSSSSLGHLQIGSLPGSSTSPVGSSTTSPKPTISGIILPNSPGSPEPVYEASDPGEIDTNFVPTSDTAVEDAESGGWSLSSFMEANPGLSYETIMSEAAKHGDEFAEKYLDYLTEKGELEAANKYTAEREDTAYQKLMLI